MFSSSFTWLLPLELFLFLWLVDFLSMLKSSWRSTEDPRLPHCLFPSLFYFEHSRIEVYVGDLRAGPKGGEVFVPSWAGSVDLAIDTRCVPFRLANDLNFFLRNEELLIESLLMKVVIMRFGEFWLSIVEPILYSCSFCWASFSWRSSSCCISTSFFLMDSWNSFLLNVRSSCSCAFAEDSFSSKVNCLLFLNMFVRLSCGDFDFFFDWELWFLFEEGDYRWGNERPFMLVVDFGMALLL